MNAEIIPSKKRTMSDIRAALQSAVKRLTAPKQKKQVQGNKPFKLSLPKVNNKFPLLKSLSDTYPCFSCERWYKDSDRYSGNTLVCIRCRVSQDEFQIVSPVPLKCSDYDPKPKEGKK